jgi:phosphomevalonate kinase
MEYQGIISSLLFVIGSRATIYGIRRLLKTSNASSRELTLACPGKVLITGGYLVLDRDNVGISVATTSKFFSTIKVISDKRISSEAPILRIFIDSPQFYESYSYEFDLLSKELLKVSQVGNGFVEICLKVVLLYVTNKVGEDAMLTMARSLNCNGEIIAIKLRAHNDFYSQIVRLKQLKKPLSFSSLAELPEFSGPLKGGIFTFP